jgi:hypothetical protein
LIRFGDFVGEVDPEDEENGEDKKNEDEKDEDLKSFIKDLQEMLLTLYT